MILGQHKAAQLRPEVTIDPTRQRRYDQVPVRCQPALPAITGAAGPQHQVLNEEIRVALEPRAGPPPSALGPPPCSATQGLAPSAQSGRVRRGHRGEPSLQGIRGKSVGEAKTALPPPVLPLVLWEAELPRRP